LPRAVTRFDVFNGDADGLCALHQLRLDTPADTVLVTGVKRDIALLARVSAQRGDAVTALDISLDSNRAALVALLELGVSVRYFDHHFAGDVPKHPGLEAFIDPSPRVCTGMLVDRFLEGRHRIWAIVAAFGDNLADAAQSLAAPLGLGPAEIGGLRDLGDALAYNAYGDCEADLIIHPADLYRKLRPHADPFAFVRDEPVYERIVATRGDDRERAGRVGPEWIFSGGAVVVLPDAAWSRRVRGAAGNDLANGAPSLAHAVLSPDAEGGFTASVRAPLARPAGADALCRSFATGGGRAGAAGINHLPKDRLQAFLRAFDEAFR
jgi:hypothetical protein